MGNVHVIVSALVISWLTVPGRVLAETPDGRYAVLKDKHLSLLRSEDCLHRDICELQREIDELNAKLRKKLRSLDAKLAAHKALKLDIKDCERDLAYSELSL